MDEQNVIRFVPTISAIAAMSALALGDVSGNTAIQNTAQEPAQSTIATPIFFGEQSAIAVGSEPTITIAECNTETDQELEMNFNRLSKKWKAETSGYYSVASMVMHPAYLEIISHGEKMIPFILKDLQQKPSHWFIALKTLAKNYSPVKPEDAGNIKKMTEAWLAWGRANGNLS